MRSANLALLAPLLLLAIGCGEDDPTGPKQDEATHFELSVQMLAIDSTWNCENAEGNLGEFRWSMDVISFDERGGSTLIASVGEQDDIPIADGERYEPDSLPIEFTLRNRADSRFGVSIRVSEWDPADAQDLDGFATVQHRRSGNDQFWGSPVPFRAGSYAQDESTGGSGVIRFSFGNRAECLVSTEYRVSWKPVTPPE